MGGMVTGLVMNTRATEMGRLTRKAMAAAAAMSIWPKGGMYIMNSPTAKAPAAERRFRCHRLGSCSSCPKTLEMLVVLQGPAVRRQYAASGASLHFAQLAPALCGTGDLFADSNGAGAPRSGVGAV